ncbi:acyl-CoA thioesterase [Sphingomonas cannabina]|uniref:acyl-CoA thioesterase n=1 Tax=Sphingomonas cannabina TaxID=2899123 RepID=UPI001F3CF151|nr:acyl-CoA thioesterase [Sphingomonas cannabina]UIJ44501.1 acyl-CoA thioesterase [Sphingomonas cannabina]
MTGTHGGVVRLIDMIFPGDTNHHGTLFGGVALAHMDKVAFLAASRHGRAPFVTAASERIDFAAPALKGELIEASGRVVRVGRSSLDVEVELVAEALLSGERRLCTRGRFTLVAMNGEGAPLPPLAEPAPEPDGLRMADIVFPPQTNHYGTLFGGDALRMLGKAAFVAATRHARAVMVMAASERVDFRSPIAEGEMIELIATVDAVGRSSLRTRVELWAEDLLTGDRRHAASAAFTMVAVDPAGRPRRVEVF